MTKSEMTISNLTRLFFAVIATSLLAACATSSSPKENTTAAAPATKAAAPVEPWDGDGMDIPLDGSSVEAFDASLARVKAHTSEANYTTLVNAIDYLQFYDLSANRDRAKVVANLNGMTGYEVLEKVKWRKPAPGKSPAEKGAADAKIIDT